MTRPRRPRDYGMAHTPAASFGSTTGGSPFRGHDSFGALFAASVQESISKELCSFCNLHPGKAPYPNRERSNRGNCRQETPQAQGGYRRRHCHCPKNGCEETPAGVGLRLVVQTGDRTFFGPQGQIRQEYLGSIEEGMLDSVVQSFIPTPGAKTSKPQSVPTNLHY